MLSDLTWHPLDERNLAATYAAALGGKPVGPETYGLGARWARRKLIKSISDAYKRAALVVLRDEPGFDPDLHVWSRPYFILEPDPEIAVDELVELETLRDAESIMQVFFRQMTRNFKRRRAAVDALARAGWSEEHAGSAGDEAIAAFRALVHRVEAACVAAEGSGRVKTVMPKRRRMTAPLLPHYDPPAFDGLKPRGSQAAQLIEASELMSYNAALWTTKIGPYWAKSGVRDSVSSLARRYAELERLTCPPSDLFDAARLRFAHVVAAMARQLDNNYSAGRYVPAQQVAEFVSWWRHNRADVIEANNGMSPAAYAVVLEAALYARVKNWSLLEASDLITPFTGRLP